MCTKEKGRLEGQGDHSKPATLIREHNRPITTVSMHASGAKEQTLQGRRVEKKGSRARGAQGDPQSVACHFIQRFAFVLLAIPKTVGRHVQLAGPSDDEAHCLLRQVTPETLECKLLC